MGGIKRGNSGIVDTVVPLGVYNEDSSVSSATNPGWTCLGSGEH